VKATHQERSRHYGDPAPPIASADVHCAPPHRAMQGAYPLGRLWIWLSALVLGWGCANPLSPSDVVGTWSALDGGHFAWTNIRFTAAGPNVEGLACRIDGEHIIFMDAPVRLVGRRVTFTATMSAGSTRSFDGTFNGDDELVGRWTDSANTLRFSRSSGYCVQQ
jgi:hypothetical protein